MRPLSSKWYVVFVLAFASMLPATASAGRNLLVSGGGTATFDDFDGGTTFTVQAFVGANGAVRGHFFCAIPGVVTIVGDNLVQAAQKADGSIEVHGIAHGWDASVGVFTGMPFALRLWPGGPGVGRFIYDDPVVGPSGGVDLAEGDRETVATGKIMFR